MQGQCLFCELNPPKLRRDGVFPAIDIEDRQLKLPSRGDSSHTACQVTGIIHMLHMKGSSCPQGVVPPGPVTRTSGREAPTIRPAKAKQRHPQGEPDVVQTAAE